MNKTFKLEKFIFTETPDVYDSIAYAFTSRIKAELEHNLRRNFNGFLVTNTSPFGERRLRGRHPRSILDKDNPFMSLSYTVDEDRADLALSSSQLITDCASFINPEYTSDLIFKNDSLNPDQNVDIRIQFSNLLMHCNIAILEDSDMLQISSRRAFDTLFETDKPYSLIMDIKIPVNRAIVESLASAFDFDLGDLDKGFEKNADEFLRFLNERSEYKHTIEFRENQNKNWIYIRVPSEILFHLSESEASSDGEDNLLVKNYLVTRRATISFNCPNIIWVIPRENSYKAKRKVDDGYNTVSIDVYRELVDKVTDTIEYKGKVLESYIRGNVIFDKSNIISLRPKLDIYESFLKYLEKNNIPYEDAIYILVREINMASRDNMESTPLVSISYKKDFLIKLNDESKKNIAFDLAIFIDTLQHKKFLESREDKMFTDYNPVYNVSDGREITISDDILKIIGK